MIGEDKRAAIGRCRDKRFEVYHRSCWGPVFGDFGISDNCNENHSGANLGSAYERINGLKFLDLGHRYFLVSEIEVFLVQ